MRGRILVIIHAKHRDRRKFSTGRGPLKCKAGSLPSMLYHHLQHGVLFALCDANGVQAVGFIAQVQR